MKVFISHSERDKDLARRVADGLHQEGLDVWLTEAEVFPGDNCARKVGQALEESQAMVVLLTPAALDSGWVRQEIEYALGSLNYRQRLIPVLVGEPTPGFMDAVPWILRRLKPVRWREPDAAGQAIKEISQALLQAA
jgi:hypothetical protein